MKLIYIETKKEVSIGDTVILDNEKMIVDGIEKPHKPSSTGRVYLRRASDKSGVPANTQGYFPSVIGAEWIEREDRGWIPGQRILKIGGIEVEDLSGIKFKARGYTCIWTVEQYHRGGAWVCREPDHNTTCDFYDEEIKSGIVSE